MSKIIKLIRARMSVRLSLWVVTFVAILIVATLSIMYHFSHQAVKEEALAKASLTLDCTVLNIDNVLRKVEVTGRMMRWNIERHLDDPKALSRDCRQMIEDNPVLMGCAIAMDSDYFHREFIIYTYRKDSKDTSGRSSKQGSEIIESDHYDESSYLEQTWYTIPKESGEASWVRPYEQGEYSEKPATYSLPVRDKEGKVVGILGLDISLRWLSEFINSTKPYPNSYCSIIGRQGGYIVHPDSTKMNRRTVFELINGPKRDTKMELLLESMMAGQSGYKEVFYNDVPSYVFYKPFRHKGWVATIVCPESEIMDGTVRLLQSALMIAMVGLLALLLFCILFIHKQMRPLSLLAETARRLSEGHYDDFVPDTRREDEIGSLQKSFKAMQQSIASRIDDIQQMNSQLEESNADLQKASEQAQQAERAMNAFLHNLSDQMLQPIVNIKDIVSQAHQDLRHLDHQEANDLAKKIQIETDVVTELLDRLLVVAGKEGGEA